jgi:hypothetical protein
MLTKPVFTQQLFNMRDAYRADNAWVQNWRSWNDDDIMKTFIEGAYGLYAATAGNALKIIVLGDTEIRSMKELLLNFGLMSANGVQETADAIMVNDLQQQRPQVAMGTAGGLAAKTSVLGPGSILSDKMWTPILNDALMLGSIECGCDFYLGLNTAEQAAWDNGGFNSDVATTSAAFGSAVASTRDRFQNKWLSFLLQQPQMLWRGGIPRVFARELIALKSFGYKPVFSKSGLAFEPGKGEMVGPVGFESYIKQLDSVKFHQSNQPMVLGAISKFLFDDPTALVR